MPARVILQDFTGVPAVVDLASMRGAVKRLGGDPTRINPLVPVDLVVDHSVQVDVFGSADALAEERGDRVRAQPRALRVPALGAEGLRQLPGGAAGHGHRPPGEPRVPGEGRAHEGRRTARTVAFPDTLVGTDSHTTMINGLGVLGWGVGGIEAEAAMLGQPLYMVTPQVVGFKLVGRLTRGHDRDRPRADRHPDPAQEGCGREVRGVLRARPRADEPGRPGHHREHGPRVRRHLRLLPGGRRDAPLPAAHRPHRRPR